MILDLLNTLMDALGGTLLDILPIILVLVFFQAVAIRKSIPHLKQKLIGLGLVVLGLRFSLWAWNNAFSR